MDFFAPSLFSVRAEADSVENSRTAAECSCLSPPPNSSSLPASRMLFFSSYAGVNDPSLFASPVGAPPDPSKSFDFVICGGEQLSIGSSR